MTDRLPSPAMDRTFVICKPDAVERGLVGEIVSRFERKGLRIVALEQRTLDRHTLARHYAEHEGKPFYEDLVRFMIRGPAVVMVLEAPDAIRKWRTLMGATDPAKADAGTLRKEFAESIERNATHGSDAPETAAYEIGYFFAGVDLV